MDLLNIANRHITTSPKLNLGAKCVHQGMPSKSRMLKVSGTEAFCYDNNMNLIIISGLPATGKSTIAKELSEKLNIPLIAKDTIKEFLFDTLGAKDRDWSRTLGKASNEFLYELTDKLLADGYSIIVENAFEKEYAKPRLEGIIRAHKPNVLEVHCSTDPDVRRKRLIERNENGDRHAGHVDTVNYPTDDDVEPLEKYAVLDIGKTLMLDTTDSKLGDIGEIVGTIEAQVSGSSSA